MPLGPQKQHRTVTNEETGAHEVKDIARGIQD